MTGVAGLKYAFAIENDWAIQIRPELSASVTYDFVSDDGVSQTVWVIDDDAVIDTLVKEFAEIPYLYIADGHHRCASAVNVAKMRREQNPDFDGTEEFNFFLAVAFKAEELKIMDYNRYKYENKKKQKENHY